jgi:cytochrome c oxidase subunit III
MSSHETSSHTSPLAHHFADMEQQRESAKLGMWVFLLTEVLLFGGLFCAYAIFRSWHPEMFHNAHKLLDVWLGGTNTVVLITSSITMALAIRSMQLNQRRNAIRFIYGTIALAGVFLVIKYFEYAHKFHMGQLPGKYYTFQGLEGTNPHVFFSIYFMMTGLHGFHVICGMGAMIWLLRRIKQGEFSADYYTPIEMTGLYWHLVDLIWIFLFPLFYLIG